MTWAMTGSEVRIAYDDLGKGEPALLCLPGWCENRTAFRRMGEACSRHRRVLALDWRGHGESGPFLGNFTIQDLVADALAVIKESGVETVVPVAVSHAGWVAVALRRRLGGRVSKAVFLDWLMIEPPASFLAILNDLQNPEAWRRTRSRLFVTWMGASNHPDVIRHLQEEMGAYGLAMWARAAREIRLAYGQWGSPLSALAVLHPPMPVLHLYAQPKDEAYLLKQRLFSASHPWFRVERLEGKTHFPAIELPEHTAAAIEAFVAGLSNGTK